MTDAFQPELFGKFFLLQRLGHGGMAEIFRAKTAGAGGFEKELVVKRILPTLSSDRQFIRMLINEAKLTVALTHPTIAQIYELGEVDGRYFISMEYVEGATLHEVMHLARHAGRPLGLEQAIYICLEVLRGLEYAHKRQDGAGNPLNIVHCDVSPDNVMLTWDGGVKLLDFGVARAAQKSLSNYREGTLMGKLSYVAPEQAEGRDFDHRVDLFAVGVIFYELLTGTHPFGKVSDVDALVASRRRQVVPPSQAAGLPKVFDDFVSRSLAYEPSQRFQSAEEMADELLQMLFPTQTMEVMALLEASMRELYRDRIEEMQRERARDAEKMQALARTHVPPPPTTPSRSSADPLEEALAKIPAASATKIFVSMQEAPRPATSVTPRPTTPRPASLPRRPRPSRGAVVAAFLGGAILGALAMAGGGFVYLEAQPRPLLVLSEPSGAEVFYEDKSLGRTPLFLPESRIPVRATLALRLPDHVDAQAPIERNGQIHVARGKLESALGRLRIESVPAGARVRLNGRPVGTTPLELDALPVDERLRFDLERDGYLLDSIVVRPREIEGGVLRRTLQRQ
ncbi:MAG TPA: protein kinase [Fredinandcohnia sp.]|nr:protein kinase [Fredinandcohnia sp.]